ncbi:MAG TPA: carboxypeptidase-like regulatory domain-containing protein [Flavisolibacter sp.]|nr:carboxypeptidase-like regulatory domain-containing protein [Flavisolibacter sp.]
MEKRSSVKGILRDASGQPVKEAVVMITDGSHEFNDMASVTNDSGEFYLSNVVVPGRYTLQIAGPAQTVTKEVSVTDSSAINITF